MPWRLRSDLQRFKRLTMGGVLVMGRKTFDSIGRPLPGRTTIVITRNSQWSCEGVETAAGPEVAVERVGQRPGFVVGGAQIYAALMPWCEQVFLTRVWSNVPGDTKLPNDWSDFRIVSRRRIPAGMRDDVPTEFLRMIRKNS